VLRSWATDLSGARAWRATPRTFWKMRLQQAPNMQDFMQIISRRPNAINVDMTRFCFCINEVLKTLKKRTARSLESQGIAGIANVTKRDCVTLFMQPLNKYATAEKGAGEGLRPAGRQARFKSAHQKIILTLSD
jgi:hypothetical protein